MSGITILQMPAFKRAYKKIHPSKRKIVDSAIRKIADDPEQGQEKKGDLAGIFVYKFYLDRQELLLAYEWNSSSRTLLCLGVHENFYRDLKRNK